MPTVPSIAPKIVLTGTFNSKNKGDSAMQLATAAAIEERWPGAIVTIASPRPDIDTAAYEPLAVVAASRRDPLRGPWSCLWALTAIGTGRRLDRWLRPLGTAEIKAMVDADLVIDLSGDMLTEDYGVIVGASHLHPLFLAWATRTPFAILAQSIGPFDRLRPVAKWLFDQAAVVTARETTTAALLEGYGWPRPDVTGDMAYLLAAKPPASARTNHETLRIGLSLSSLASGKYDPDGGPELPEMVGDVIKRVAERHDAEVLIVAHVTGPNNEKDDRIPARRAAEVIGTRATAVDEDLDPAAIKGLIGTCDVFVGARMHANIAALTQAVPTLALSYSHKFRGIMAEFGQADFVIEIEDLTPELFEQRLDALIAQAEACRPTIARAAKRLATASRRNLEALEAVLP